jgi:hypothetical protein
MSISCKICDIEFEKIIPWQHLKLHNISTSDYKKQYNCSVYSQNTLDKFKSRIPHNKGKKITDVNQLLKIKEAINKREHRYQQGEFNRGSTKTIEQKEVLSKRTKEYANRHKEEMIERAHKAVETKIKNGYDFGKNMRGKTHSQETKEKIKNKSINIIQEKTIRFYKNILEKLLELDLSLIGPITETQLNLECNKCHTKFSFTKQYFTPSKFKTSMCPICFPRTIARSRGELELFNFIKSLSPDAISGYREKYHSKEIDIFIPSLNIGIEFNGLYWHSEPALLANNRSPKSDFIKQQTFIDQGVRMIIIFEDEWSNHKEIVKSRISNILKRTTNSIYARKCQVKEVSSIDSAAFCNINHIMGKGRSNFRIGLFYDDKLVSLMTFTKNNLSRKSKDTWEINRFASLLNTNVVGAASKLFKFFLKNIDPVKVISYADNRWSTGELYKHLEFKKINNGTPNYWYIQSNILQRIHRFTLRKTKKDDRNLTEFQIRTNQGYTRIWDCGSSKWLWSKAGI